MDLKPQLTLQLKQLRLSGILDTLDDRCRRGIQEKWSFLDFLARLLEDEIERRAQKQLQLRLRRGALNSAKTIEEYDFDFHPSLNRQQLLSLTDCDYIREHRNLVIAGPSGVGKSHIAQALGQEACRRGFDVVFTNTAKMVAHLHGGRADGSLEKRMNTFIRPDLLILDDFGLKPLQPPGPEDLYDIISERYEKGSILITSNRTPNEWPALFIDPLLASAGLDRLLHRAEVVIMKGKSYRARGRANLRRETWGAEEAPEEKD